MTHSIRSRRPRAVAQLSRACSSFSGLRIVARFVEPERRRARRRSIFVALRRAGPCPCRRPASSSASCRSERPAACVVASTDDARSRPAGPCSQLASSSSLLDRLGAFVLRRCPCARTRCDVDDDALDARRHLERAFLTSPAFSPKIARSSFSSGVSSVSPFGVTLPTRMSPGLTSAPMRTMPRSSRSLRASSPTFGMSR